jgi:predicted O-linked N-acetylglucosamine transferase (SPINDLY family)
MNAQQERAEVHFKLGNALSGQGRLDEAEACFRHAIALDPDYVKALYNLGNTLKRLGRTNEAEHCYRRVTEIDPSYTNAHNNLGVLLLDQSRHHEATEIYRHILTIQPGDAVALNNLGLALMGLNQLQDAESVLQHALVARPDYPEAYNNLGIVLKEQGRFAAAEAHFRSALNLRHDYAEAFNNLGTTLKAQGHLDEAESAYRRTLELIPTHLGALNNLGCYLRENGRLNDAEFVLRNALASQPDSPLILNSLGSVLMNQLRATEGIQCFRRSLKLQSDYPECHSNLLFAMCYDNTTQPVLLEESRNYGKVLSRKVAHPFHSWLHKPDPDRLRIGVISGDLRNHPVSYFLDAVVRHINSGRIELFAYSTQNQTDEMTEHLRPHFASWKSLVGLSDEHAANTIRNDGIHILIDLAGHTSNNRLPIFAWKPAPLSASWLGYFATTGVAQIDYILVDEVGVPTYQQHNFTERVWYLPETRLCFTAPTTQLPIAPLPAIKNGYITFGCFQNMAKVDDHVLAVWARILTTIVNSRLRVQSRQLDTPLAAKNLVLRLQHHGIAADKVVIFGGTSREAYLAAHAEVDLILDTFPYTGGTTTCEALWMGVPTLTLAGNSLLSRQGASLLCAAGLPEFVATDEADYIEKSRRLADNIPKLAALRSNLRKLLPDSPLFDAARFARNLETALWNMWQERVQAH